jgi:DNA-binding LacI/PurR family transcriptional regulator
MVALGAMQAIRERGFSIPEDISVVGFDDVPIARFFHPPLTTVRQPGVDIGLAAGELLLRLMNGETSVPSALIAFQLMERESACPCKERIGL